MGDSSSAGVNRALAEELVEQARADGVELVGPGRLLSQLTKQVLGFDEVVTRVEVTVVFDGERISARLDKDAHGG